MPWLLTLVPHNRGELAPIQVGPPLLQLTNLEAMTKSESDTKNAAAVEEDDEPDEWWESWSQQAVPKH